MSSCRRRSRIAGRALHREPTRRRRGPRGDRPQSRAPHDGARRHRGHINFDRPVAPRRSPPRRFRVFGRWSGTRERPFSFSNGDQTVTFTPSAPFSAGEVVLVNLAETITRRRRDAAAQPPGYAFQFSIAIAGRADLDVHRDRRRCPTASARRADAHLRRHRPRTSTTTAMLDLDDGERGQRRHARLPEPRRRHRALRRFPRSAVPIGFEASPNEPADFNNDGNVDSVSSRPTMSEDVWMLLGAGDGTFAPTQAVADGHAAARHRAARRRRRRRPRHRQRVNYGSNNLALLHQQRQRRVRRGDVLRRRRQRRVRPRRRAT